jgi:hypothetical protein
MNIFAIDQNPEIAARHLVDRHVGKLVLESNQILTNCFSDNQLARSDCPRTQVGTIRKHSYPHHPCCKWVQESKSNMRWLISHALELDRERMARFNKNKEHFSLAFIKWCAININDSRVPEGGLTPFCQAMPEEFKNKDAIIAYRNYYKFGKVHLHKWTRNKPNWIEQ